MNPFDLTGPLFLLVYLLFGIAVAFFVVAVRKSMEPIDGPRLNMSDPYPIAYLRGGAGEVLRLATISLVGRNLLKVQDDKISVPRDTDRKGARPNIETEVIQFFTSEDDPTKLFAGVSARTAAEAYRERLIDLGFLPDDALRQRRLLLFGGAILVLWATAFYKILLAFERGRHNVGFLIVLALIFAFVVYKLCTPKQTQLGQRILKDLKTLLAGAEAKIKAKQVRVVMDETMLIAAVFGTATLAGMGYPWVHKVFPKAAASQSSSDSSCGSTCGSSGDSGGGGDSGGSSCGSSCGGGGGCGGCGS